MSTEPPPPEGDEEPPSIARFSVRQPVLVNLVAIAMMATGLLVLSQMTREVYPIVPIGAASVVTLMPGASAEEIEQLVTAPIEDELSNIEDVDIMSSTSSDGMSFIWVELEPTVEDVTNALPKELKEMMDDPRYAVTVEEKEPEAGVFGIWIDAQAEFFKARKLEEAEDVDV